VAAADRPGLLVLGCPARDAADELALQMFAQLLHAKPCRTEVLSAQMLTAEVIARVEKDRPFLVCIGSLPPGGLAQARYLCKRLRTQCAELKIAVGRWGQGDNVEKTLERLRAAGADFVATTFLESQNQVSPLIDTAALAPGNSRPRKATPQKV
jgi:hypothetical protein